MSSETISFESFDALEQAISALRIRNRSEDKPQPSSVEITFGHSVEAAELSATTAASTEACSIDSEPTASEDEESDSAIEIPDVSEVEGVSQEITQSLLLALDSLGGFATTSQIAEQAGMEVNTASSYFSRLYSAGIVERTEDTSSEGRRFIYILS